MFVKYRVEHKISEFPASVAVVNSATGDILCICRNVPGAEACFTAFKNLYPATKFEIVDVISTSNNG